MSRIWGIHSNQPDLDLVENGFISVGWPAVGDLSQVGSDKDAMKERVAATHPGAKPGAIPVWAGVLLRFAFAMEPGDLVIYPYKPDSTLNFGRISGDYYYLPGEEEQPNRRNVEWLETGIPRAKFSKSARYEVGSAITLFRVKNNAGEFEAFLDGHETEPKNAGASVAKEAEEAAAVAEDEPSPQRIEAYTRDFVVDTLMTEIDGGAFEYFVADVLRAMGYRARVTQLSGDGGFDVLAYRDPLGLEPPLVKVQCKRTLAGIGAPKVQALIGTLSPSGSELGLFVTLGSYSKDAKALGKTYSNLRLIDGTELVDLMMEHYDQLSPEWRRLLPLRAVYAVDRDPEGN